MSHKSVLPEDIKLRHESQLENPLEWKHEKKGLSDHFAQAACDFLGFFADQFFRKRYGHRAIVLETVAAVPGMVAAMFNHLSSLRRMKHDSGRIRLLMDEAENERMHLMTFLEITKPTKFERALIFGAQGMFFTGFSLAYLFSPRTAHRFVGLIEEKAVNSYTEYLKEVEAGRIENVDAPDIAKKYWNLPEDAKLKDVIIAVRNDEAEHRDVNHKLADQIDNRKKSFTHSAPGTP
jgi:ubiquinol oxidase